MDRRRIERWLGALAAAVLILCPATAPAGDDIGSTSDANLDQLWAIHGQATVVEQGHPAFDSPYAGAHSFSGDAEGRETADVTLFAGLRPWRGAEIWINPEVDQGFGLDDTLGVAGFPSAEAYKIGKATPYLRLQRAFIRQTIDLSGGGDRIDPDLNQLGSGHTQNRLTLWLGKFSVVDVFDTNDLAHDPKHDFLNWGVVDAATFDYAADPWGYTYGLAVEWRQGPWTLRTGLFDLSEVPNGERLDPRFDQFQMIGELERRYAIAGRAGALKVTAYLTRGRMGLFADAIALGEATGAPPDVTLVRRYRGRGGLSFNLRQQITADLSLFARGGFANGDVESYEFTDVDQSVSGGFSLGGAAWKRPADTIGLAAEANGITAEHLTYLAGGGLGILIGDGRLPHPGGETILETYYDAALGKILRLGLDYQFVNNPAYNRDRGPASVFAARLHAQF